MAVYIAYHETMQDVAKRLERDHDQVKLLHIKWERFPDGFPKIRFDAEDIQAARGARSVVFLSNLAEPSIIFEQIAAIYAMPSHQVPNLRVFVPWFSTGTMERISQYGEVATAKSLARMLSATPMTRGGPVSFSVFDIHALQEQFYFGDNVFVQLYTACPLLQEKIELLEDRAQVSICFPDDGAHKRYQTQFPKEAYGHIVCGKERDLHDPAIRKVKVKEGDASGKHCIIVDDLVQSGGTLIECAKGLKEAGATKISCWVTHGIFPKESWRKFTEGEAKDLIHKFWITDSVPMTAAAVRDLEPFEVLSLAPEIARIIM